MSFSSSATEVGGALVASGTGLFLAYKLGERFVNDWKRLKIRAHRPKPFGAIKARLDAMNDVPLEP